MMYVRDDVVDAVVAKDQTLQDVVQGRRLMLWRPGTLATVAAQGCMMFGGIGLLGSVLWLWPITTNSFKYAFFCGLLPLATTTAGLFQGVVRGWPPARTYSYRFAIVMTSLSACVAFASLALWKIISLGCAAVGLVFHLGAIWLIAGEGYALTSALFRAQRKFTLKQRSAR